jgi:hypothetical protein
MENFNQYPYYDDFDPTKNFHRILFKPGYSVQGRELTQSQTILQDQISKFASNIFQQNTPVTGGQVTTNLNCYYLKLNGAYNGSSIKAANFLNQTITDVTGTIIAKVVATAEATNAAGTGDPPTLIITYSSGVQFTDGTQIFAKGTNFVATTIGTTLSGNTTCTGLSSVASVAQGVYYIVNGWSQSSSPNPDGTYTKYSIGNFVNVAPQTIILDKYDATPTYRIGLQINESIVDYTTDTSLLDPAVGASNYQAPGADRYEISLTLTALPLTLGSDDSFIELVRIENGQLIKQVNGTVYSVIDDYFAKRDYETNGDYIVQDFKLISSANGAMNTNMDLGSGSDPNSYDLSIGKGVAYVRGYRIENQSQQLLNIPRARTTNTIQTNNIFVDYGNYFVVDTLSGIFDATSQPYVDLHCVASANIGLSGQTNYTSTLVGSARLRGLKYVTSQGANTQTYIFNAYVCDIATNTLSGTVASATSTTLVVNDTSGTFSNINGAYVGVTLSMTSGGDVGNALAITGYTVSGSTKTFTVETPFIVTPSSSDTFSLLFAINDIDCIVTQNGYTSLTANANISVVGGGKSGPTQTSPTVLQSSGTSEMIFPIGNPYVANVANTSFYSTMLFRNQRWNNTSKTLTLSISQPGISFVGPLNTGLYGEQFKQLFTIVDTTTGQIQDFTYSGNTATLSTNTTVMFSSSVYGTDTNPVDVYAQVFIPNGEGASSVLKYKTLVTGNTSYCPAQASFTTVTSNNYVDLTTGQAYIQNNVIGTSAISLYVNDVKRITKIIDTGSTTTTPFSSSLSGFKDITGSFSFDNGQRDNSYEFATITLIPGAIKPIGNILVCFDHYSHSGGDGYFNIQSYINEEYASIPSYTAKDGTTYALRDCMDFRPAKQNATTSGAWEYNNNPTSSPYNGGILLPQNNVGIIDSYAYYLGRQDLLVLTKDSQFKVISGAPDLKPILPDAPSGSLVIANLIHDPYTAYVPGENPDGVPANLSINKIAHKNWRKSDITDLQTQVDNMEYYAALNQLEASAAATQVPDNNGITRPNYGILVDDFSSFATADSTQPNYAANINIRKKQMGPLNSVTNFQLQNPQVLNSLGTANNFNTFAVNSISGTQTNIYTLPYTTANLISQVLASNTVSVNPFSVVVEQGFLSLNPPMDNWVNTVEVPMITINDPTLQFSQQAGGVNLTNAGDFASLPGTQQLLTSSQTTITATSGVNSTSNPTASFIAQPAQTYVAQTQGLNSAQLSSASSPALSVSNGYVNNDAVVPNIRPQEIIVRAKNLLVNSPIHCFFDGTLVDQWMTSPNTIELTNVTGTFNQDDIVGYYEPSVTDFFPIARVVSAYNYPGTSNWRLYIATMIGLPSTVTTNATFQNAFFDINGNYIGQTASGTVSLNGKTITDLHTSGIVSNIGGGFKNSANTSLPAVTNYKSAIVNGWSDFLNNYGAWGDNSDGSSWNSSSYSFTPTITGTYTVTYAGGDISTSGIYFSTTSGSTGTQVGSTISSLTTDPQTITLSLTAGTTYYLNYALTNTGGGAYTGPAFALTVSDPSGNIVWDTLAPPNITTTSGTIYNMPQGGNYYIGATSLQLDGNASTANNIYIGSSITIKSTYTYTYNYGSVYYPPPPPFSGDGDCGNVSRYQAAVAQYNAQINQEVISLQNQTITLSTTGTFTANITGYNGVTKTVTLDTPVNISTGYNNQYGQIQSQYTINGTATSVADAISVGSSIPSLSTNENGEFVAIFNVPGSMFWTGQRVFRVDNRSIMNMPSSATTWAEGTFWATGLQSTQQLPDFASTVDSTSVTFNQTAQTGYNLVSQAPKIDPIAQTFMVDKTNYPNGVFLNSLNLFFAPFTNNNTPNVPVSVYLLNTLNGYPTGQALAHSTATVSSQFVNTSTNPSTSNTATATVFTFDAPVYIQPGVLYAFVVQSSSADYNLWYAQQNEIAINYASGGVPTKIGQTPYTGSLFESQNSITWTADQTKNLMFEIDQCVFSNPGGSNIQFVVPKGLPYRKLGRHDIQHSISANSVPNVYSLYAQNQLVDAINVSTTDFIPTGTSINYSYQTTLASTGAVTSQQPINPGKYGTPTQDNVYLNDGQGERALFKNSANSFQLYASLATTDTNVSPVISDDGVSLYSIVYHINNMGIDGNIINVANTGTGYNANTLSITCSAPDVGSDYPLFGFKQNTVTGGITSIYTTYPGSGYHTTPTITISDPSTRSGNTNAVVTVQGETSPFGGNGYAKYFTKKVIMVPGNDSGDMRVYYSAYKPIGTDVLVYYKILSSADSSQFDAQSWQLMTQTTEVGTYSTDRNDVIEFECAPGTSNQAANKISYTSTNGKTYNNFIQFQIKVVMKTNDRTNVPFLSDIRAIALPSGTGL